MLVHCIFFRSRILKITLPWGFKKTLPSLGLEVTESSVSTMLSIQKCEEAYIICPNLFPNQFKGKGSFAHAVRSCHDVRTSFRVNVHQAGRLQRKWEIVLTSSRHTGANSFFNSFWCCTLPPSQNQVLVCQGLL